LYVKMLGIVHRLVTACQVAYQWLFKILERYFRYESSIHWTTFINRVSFICYANNQILHVIFGWIFNFKKKSIYKLPYSSIAPIREPNYET